MSPDPPREDRSQDDENNLRRFSGEFVEGVVMDEFPDGPYEMDMENESDYTDTDEEDQERNQNLQDSIAATGQNSQNQSLEEGAAASESTTIRVVEGQGRGRYRLLIPFPEPISSTIMEESLEHANQIERIVGGGERESLPTNSAEVQDIKTSHENDSSSSDKASTSKKCQHDSKREIELTEEKVETIMQVMKNISLPSTSIPKWAAEVDENAWKKKLHETISTSKPSLSTNASDYPTTHNVPLFEANFEDR